MKKLVVAAVVGVALTLAACGPGAPKSGVVVDRSFTPAHTETYYVTVFTGKTSILVPEQRYVGDEWQLELKNGTQEGWVDVDQHDYDTHKVGSHYTQ